jgi:hypothetical protein
MAASESVLDEDFRCGKCLIFKKVLTKWQWGFGRNSPPRAIVMNARA